MAAEQETAITKIGPLVPVFDKPELVQANIKTFREACKKVLDPKVDIVVINGKEFIRKSGWNVLNQYLGVETKPTKSWRTELDDGEYMITVVVEASLGGKHPQSRSASCTSMEMKAKHKNEAYINMESHCYGMAETRAVGRASAAWFMIGDPAAEEIGDNAFAESTTKPKAEICACTDEQTVYDGTVPRCRHCGGKITEQKLTRMANKKAEKEEK